MNNTHYNMIDTLIFLDKDLWEELCSDFSAHKNLAVEIIPRWIREHEMPNQVAHTYLDCIRWSKKESYRFFEGEKWVPPGALKFREKRKGEVL